LTILRPVSGEVERAKHLPPGGQIKAIQEDGTQFTLQFKDGSTATLQLAAGSVGGGPG